MKPRYPGIAPGSGRIYWSGLNNNSIGHAKTDGTGILNNLVTGADEGGPQGIAITGSALRTASAGPGALDFGRRPHRTRARPSHSPSPIRDRATEDLLRTERNA